MRTQAKVLAHSANPAGCELVTFELCFPRILLSQLNTYKTLAVSARSSRAVPTERLIREAEESPFVPAVWRRKKKGMVAGEVMTEAEEADCRDLWLKGRDAAVSYALCLAARGAAKEHVNRLLEPFAWAWAVVTGSRPRVEHLIRQRTAGDAQPEFRELAGLMREALAASVPKRLAVGDWHLCYLTPQDRRRLADHWHDDDERRVSAARAARVSYRPFDSESADIAADLQLSHRLERDGHMSPFEHVAMSCESEISHGKYQGFLSFRAAIGR